MPYNGAKVKRDRAALAQAIIRAKTPCTKVAARAIRSASSFAKTIR